MVPTDEIAPPGRNKSRDGSALLLALLIFVWGVVSLARAPRDPFLVPNLIQTVGGGIAAVYFFRTRLPPRSPIPAVFKAITIVYTLVLLPWVATAWSALERPLESFTIPQLAAVAVPLVIRRRWLALVLIALFIAEGVFAYAYASKIGLAALLPHGEPLLTIFFGILSLCLLVLREQRRRLTQRHMKVAAEVDALHAVGTLFDRVRHEVSSHLSQISTALAVAEARADELRRESSLRALDRVGTVERQLDELVDAPVVRTHPQTEEEYRARDAQTGATVFAILLLVLSIQTVAFGAPLPPGRFIAIGCASASGLLYLLVTRRRPSERAAHVVVVVLWAGLVAVAITVQIEYLALGRPFVPFLAHKIFVVVLGLVVSTRIWLGLVLIGLTTVSAIVTYFALGMTGLPHISMFEPWVMLIYAGVGAAAAVLRDQRRIASIELRRAESEAETLERRALLCLALRDRLNSSVQTIVLGESMLVAGCSPRAIEQVHSGVEGLVALCRELEMLDHMLTPELHRAQFDADAELRPHA